MEAFREDVVSPLHRAPSCCPVGLCQAPDEQEPGQGGHGLGHRFPSPSPSNPGEKGVFSHMLYTLFSFLCVLITARDEEELGIHNHEGFWLSFWTDISPFLPADSPFFPSPNHFPAPNPALEPSSSLPCILVLAFSVSKELNKPLWRQAHVVASPFTP